MPEMMPFVRESAGLGGRRMALHKRVTRARRRAPRASNRVAREPALEGEPGIEQLDRFESGLFQQSHVLLGR